MNDKRIFDQVESEPELNYQTKQEFNEQQATIEPDEIIEDSLDRQFDQVVQTKSNWWIRLLIIITWLFLLACTAQSIQWLWNSLQQGQWIYFTFSLVSLLMILMGITAIAKEFANLRKLRRHLLSQQQSQKLQQSAVQFSEDFDYQYAHRFCLDIAANMKLSPQHLALIQWQNQIDETHTGKEVALLFSKNVLQPIDQKAKKLISKNAIETTIVISITPLALVDMFFMAWRNIRLINQLASLYGMELGYFSRLRLMKLVLMNMALTGATELVQDIGMDWLSQDLTAKLSRRVAQGIGAGLLTARLGIKTMEFCRPLAFQQNEKPSLNHIHLELLTHVKNHLFKMPKKKQKETL